VNGRIASAEVVTVAGDDLPCLQALRPAHPQEVPTDREARAVVLGVDLSSTTGRDEVKRELERQSASAEQLCARMPKLQQVVLVLSSSPGIDDVHLLKLARKCASRLHAQLEQSCGSYVSVTALVAGDCDDRKLLASRILDRAARTASIDPASALLWSEIVDEPIEEAGATDYV
jgi:hypothetical protein